MLSLLRWGLGSGPEFLSEKEQLAAAEAAAAAAERSAAAVVAAAAQAASCREADRRAAVAAAAAMDTTRPAKRKRAETATAVTGLQAKQAKRQAMGHARPSSASAISMDSRLSEAPRVVNSPGVLAQLAGRDAATTVPVSSLVTVPSTIVPHAPTSLLSQANLGVIDVPMSLAAPASASAPVAAIETSKLQQTIAAEFGLEILLKHNELRLIDQELAKCQVALEQLRRCQTVPYPSQVSDLSARLDVSSGIGRPVRNAHARQADYPPPWGIVEGPYSRHYSQWLLPDPAFDGSALPEECAATPRTGKLLPDRHTRGNKNEHLALASKRMRGLATPSSARLQSMPTGYAEAKEHKGPMILKRAADDKLVKLVCLDCKREDFNSAQGFINHCRIAHSRGYASHEAAAQACGQEIDTEVVSAAPVATPLEPVSAMISTAGTFVHPLVKPSAVPVLSIPIPRAQRAAANAPRTTPLVKNHTAPVSSSGSSSGSSTTPHLSKLFAMASRTGDLSRLIADAKVPTDLDAFSSDIEEGDNDSDFDAGETSDTSSAPVMARMPSRGGLMRGAGFKSIGPVASAQESGHPSPLDLCDKRADLSPHTIESNVAPSLVSDNDDDDYEDSHGSSTPSEASDLGDGTEMHIDMDVDVEGDDVPRLRGGRGHLESPLHGPLRGTCKGGDLELQTGANGNVGAPCVGRNGLDGEKNEGPKKRGRPRKMQS